MYIYTHFQTVAILKKNLYAFCFLIYNIYIYKPLKSEVIHETGLSGNVVASLFPSHNIYIYI